MGCGSSQRPVQKNSAPNQALNQPSTQAAPAGQYSAPAAGPASAPAANDEKKVQTKGTTTEPDLSRANIVTNAAELLRCVKEGGVIVVQQGEYTIDEALECSVSCTIVGDRNARKRPLLTGFDLVSVAETGVEVVLINLSFFVPLSDDGMGSSCVVVKEGKCTVFDCLLSSQQYHGAEVSNGGFLIVENTVIKDCSKNGVDVMNEANATLIGCEITGSGDHGARVTDSATVIMRECDISGNKRDGVDVNELATLTITNCLVRNNTDAGLFVYNDAHVNVEQCVFCNNGTALLMT